MGTLAVATKTLHGLNVLTDVSRIGSTVKYREKPTVILYTYINQHVGTPKQQEGILLDVQNVLIQDHSNMVIKRNIADRSMFPP